jgi:sodium transport system permease protein
MKGIRIVLRKEMLDNIRDRRSLFNSLLLGPILFPMLFLGLSYFGVAMQQERIEQSLEIPVVGGEYAPNFIGFLEQQGVMVLPAPEDPETEVRQQTSLVVLRIPEDFAELWQKGIPAPIEIISESSRPESRTAMFRLNNLIQLYSRQIGIFRIQLRGVSPNLSTPIQIIDVDLATPQSRALLVMIFLPYILMLTAFTGAMHIAMDSTAGEKERASLEPLLINPIPRWQFMAGKMLATTLFSFVSLALTLISFKLVLPFMPIDQLGLDLTVTIKVVLQVLLVISPVTLLAGAMLTMFASFAKSYKEAQSYMGLIILIPIIPSMLFMANPLKPETSMMWAPIFSQNLMIGEILRGESVQASWFLLSMSGTLILALILALIAASLYNRPKLIFNSE